MKLTSKTLLPLLGAALLAAAPYVRSQGADQNAPDQSGSDQNAPQNPPEHRHGGRGNGPMARLFQNINGLTDAQHQQIEAIMKDSGKQMRALRDDDSLSDDERRGKMQEIRKDTFQKVRAVLNPDQQKQFDANVHKMMHRRREAEDNGNGGTSESGAPADQSAPPPPPPGNPPPPSGNPPPAPPSSN